MKVDTNRLKKGTSEVPPECKQLIDRLSKCNRIELIMELSKIETWTFGKCELYHWIDILDIFDGILDEATKLNDNNEWLLTCDINSNDDNVLLLLYVLNFTTLLIEHSFSRHLYNSVEHLTKLLSSSNMDIVLGVLNLLYMFSKRSNFISRLNSSKKNSLLTKLNHIAESWGGKEYEFSLANCCTDGADLPKSASTFFYEFYNANGSLDTIEYPDINSIIGSHKNVAELTKTVCKNLENLDDDQKMHIFTRIRLALSFNKYPARLQFVQARLQGLSVLVYSNSLQDNIHTLLYPGFLEELVELLELKDTSLVEIRAAALRTLTSIIHLDRNPHFPKKPGSRLGMIIDVTGAASYHGFLPTLVRSCIHNLTSILPHNPTTEQETETGTTTETTKDDKMKKMDVDDDISIYDLTGSCSTSLSSFTSAVQQHELQHEYQQLLNLFPLPLATALFSFLYHLASYESGGEALVACGIMESLLRVINWPGFELEHITFVTRAVRVIDLITNIEMQSFQLHNGLDSFIGRLDMEVNYCRSEQPNEIEPTTSITKLESIINNDDNISNNSSNNINLINDNNSCVSSNYYDILDQSHLQQNQDETIYISDDTIMSSDDVILIPPESSLITTTTTTTTAAAAETTTTRTTTLSGTSSSISSLNLSTAFMDVSYLDDSVFLHDDDPDNVNSSFTIDNNDPDNLNSTFTIDDEPTVIENSPISLLEQQETSNNDNDDDDNTKQIIIKTCLPQRAALLKSMLNFLKKAIQDQAFSDSIRHIMEGTLPLSLRHIISNAEYYGPSLFLLATDVVTVYVFQEPSLLSSLQDNGLTDIVLQALLKKDVPATREVLGSLPNVFSALCLNSRGLQSFVQYEPFERLFKVLLSPVYLMAMRRRRSNEPLGDTASNLGNAMDELMRHQPSLKTEATKAIIKLLHELVNLGTDPKYICWRANNKNDLITSITQNNNNRSTNNVNTINGIGVGINGNNSNNGGIIISGNEAGSSDEDDDDEEEASTSSHHNQRDERNNHDNLSTINENNSNRVNTAQQSTSSANQNLLNDSTNTTTINNENNEREPIPFIDYILNVMKFIDAILSNNSTDDHCREFVQLNGLQPLLSILSLPNLPV